MAKRLFWFVLTALLCISALVCTSFAAEEPKLTSDAKVYVDFTYGKNANSGLTAGEAKKQLLTLADSGAVSLMKDGGTMIASGKLFIGGSYTLPELGGTLLITSNDGTTDYKNPQPETNPACAMKLYTGATLTLISDVIIDDIILFQEAATSNEIKVSGGATLVIGEKVVTMGSALSSEPCYLSLYCGPGATLIVKAGTFQKISGEGTIVIADGVTVLESDEPETPADPRSAVANALYSLGLLSGYDADGNDFGLDDALTRAQAVVLIERYLGVAEAAATTTAKAPFGDVPAWADPYVAYAVQNNLVSGKTDANGNSYFDPDAKMSEKEFLTLLLRAMEYTDKNDGSGDFVWSDPYTLAASVGLIDHTAENTNFLRCDAFAACCNALASKCKGGKTVSEKLIDAGIITEKAYGYAKRIANGETIVVACVGDSVTKGTGTTSAAKYSYPAQLQKMLGKGFEVVNCGIGTSYVMNPASKYNTKAHIPHLWYPNTDEYKKLMASSPDIVIMMLGTNDARSMTTKAAEADFLTEYKALIADIQAMESKPELYLSTMIPAANADITYQGTVYTLPDLIRGVAEELHLPLIDTAVTLHDYYNVMLPYGDMVHPTDVTYPALATNFYNQVFGHDAALPELPKASGNVVYVSGSGKSTNGGTSPSDAVDTLGLAVAMLREKGGTIVVCGALNVKQTYFIECGGPVTITSVYGGVDYRTEKYARVNLTGSLTLASDLMLENITIYTTKSDYSISCCYNNFTVGDGVSCSGETLAINAGYRIGAGALTPEDVSCHQDCTIKVAGGKWALLRGGNMRANPMDPVGSVDKGVKLSIYISGGEFTNKSVNANSGIGMNGCEGEAYFEISGGKFAGSVAGIHRTGTNNTDTKATFGGQITVKVTGGEFATPFKLYHTADTPEVIGRAQLMLTKNMESVVTQDGFGVVEFID